MKKTILVLTLLLSFNINAEESKDTPATPQEICDLIGHTAETIMTYRQYSLDIDKAFKLIKDAYPHKKSHQEYFTPIILKAYETPIWKGEKYQKLEIKEFKDKYKVKCFREFYNAGELK